MTQPLLQNQPNSINWAVDELNNELNQVLRILEKHAENPEGEVELDECMQHLKHVTGIFAVTSMAIPQLLGEELQTALSDYSTQSCQAATDTISLVVEAILELSSYLGNPKRIKRLIPEINNLRALTKSELVTESSAVEIDLKKGFRAFKKSSAQLLDSQTIRKLRMLYQKTVLSLFKSGLTKENLGDLQKVFKIFYQMGGTPYLSALGYSGLSLVERLQSKNLTLNIALKSLFKRLDDVLKKLNAGTDYEDLGLLKNILYYVSCGADHGGLSSKLIEIFSLQDFADDPSSDRKKRFLPLHKLMADNLDHLIIAEQFISDWQQGKISDEDLDGLHADVKLLQEVSASCKVGEIAKLCQLIESVQTKITGQDSLEEAQSQWMDQAYGLLLKMLDAVASWQVVPKINNELSNNIPQIAGHLEDQPTFEEEPSDTIDEMDSDEESPTIELEPDSPIEDDLQFDSIFIDPEDEFQQELLDTFLGEADDLMQEIDTSINNWRREPTAFENADLIHRALHTLKGGARLSDLTKLGDYSHNFESFIIDHQILQKADDKFFIKALERLDRLNTHIEAIREAMLSGASVEDLPAPDAPEKADETENTVELTTEDASSVKEAPSDAPTIKVISAEELAPTESDSPVRDAEKVSEQIQEISSEPNADINSDTRAFEARQYRQENIRLRSDLVDEMINLSSEATVYRGQVEAQLSGLETNLDELEATIGRIQQLARRLDTETEAQIQFRSEQLAQSGEEEDFDPLEMDRYSTLQQLSHQLIESASDLQDLRASLSETNRDTKLLLVQSGRIQSELNAQLMRTRMVPFERLLPRLERIVRTVSRELNKKAEIRALDISGEMDRTVLEQLVPPIEHILRNSIDHGIENSEGRQQSHKPEIGRITFNLHREGSYMVLTISDDGVGIDFEVVRRRAIERGLVSEADSSSLTKEEIAEFLFMPGFSTAQTVTQISGRGVGMDVVKATIREMGGSIGVSSELGQGTQFQLSIPFTTSINRALMVHCGEDLYALPLASLEALVRISRTDLQSYYQNPQKKLAYGADKYDFGYLGELLKTRERPPIDVIIEPTVSVVLFRVGNHRLALLIDEIVGSKEVVVKSLSHPFNTVPGLSGAAIMGDGSVVVTLDVPALIAGHYTSSDLSTDQKSIIHTHQEAHTPTIMVVDDSVTVRKVTSRFLSREGYVVETARDGAEALRMVHDQAPDLMLVDVEMPRMDGFELLGTLRSSDKFKDLPIVLITSRTGEKHKQRGLSLGANNYIGKPYREDQLLEEIKRVLGGN